MTVEQVYDGLIEVPESTEAVYKRLSLHCRQEQYFYFDGRPVRRLLYSTQEYSLYLIDEPESEAKSEVHDWGIKSTLA
jgi:hypothetical protein